MSQKTESQFLHNLSKKLMTLTSFKDAVNRNEWFQSSLLDDNFVREMMDFAEIGNGFYSQADIKTWRRIFSKLVLLNDGIIHTEIEMDILGKINYCLQRYSNLLKPRYYDRDNYIDYSISAQNQSDIRHDESDGNNHIWFVRYGNRHTVDPTDFANQAQFNLANGALAFNISSYFEIADFESLIAEAGFRIYTDPNPNLDLGPNPAANINNYPRWVEINTLDDIIQLAPAIIYCYKKRLSDFAKILTNAANAI